MSETTSFTDPVYLARFGLFRTNAIDYFLHPLNPFRTKANTSNEVLAMQGTTIPLLMQQGVFQQVVLTAQAAEQEYHKALAHLTGEQYELLPPDDPTPLGYTQPSPLYTIRHVLRTSPSSVKVLGIYYIVEGIIYKSPAVQSLCKANVARILACLQGATQSLSACARFQQPSLGYQWYYQSGSGGATTKSEPTPHELRQLQKYQQRLQKVARRPGERTAAEEEGMRATEALDQILERLERS
jgi:hypothetical protein